MALPTWLSWLACLNQSMTHVQAFLRNFHCAYLLRLPVHYRARAISFLDPAEGPQGGMILVMLPAYSRAYLRTLRGLLEWSRCLDSRIAEWQLLLTISCLFVASILTLLQTQEVGSDPITRSLVFLGAFHAFFGVIYCLALLFYFTSDDTRTVEYFLVWLRVHITLWRLSRVQNHVHWSPGCPKQPGRCLLEPMDYVGPSHRRDILARACSALNFQLSATMSHPFRATIFSILATFSSVWHPVSPSFPPSMPGVLQPTMGAIVTLPPSIDIAYLVGILVTFCRHAQDVHDEEIGSILLISCWMVDLYFAFVFGCAFGTTASQLNYIHIVNARPWSA